MAIIGTDQDEWTQKAPQAAPAAGTAPAPTGGASGSIGGGSGQGATTAVRSSSAPTASGNYTNLVSYLGASGGNGDAMGKTAENVVGGMNQQAGQALQSYQGDANKQIQAGITPGAKTTAQNADGTVTTTTGATTYNGPRTTAGFTGQAATDYGNYTSLANQVGGAAKQAGGGQTGVQSLLRGSNGEGGIYAQPSYTAGESGLDAFLTGATPSGQASLKSIQSMPGALDTKAFQTDKALNNNMAGAIETANASKPTSVTTGAPHPIALQTQTVAPTLGTSSSNATIKQVDPGDAAAAANLAKETAARNAAIAKAAAGGTKTGKAGSAAAPAPTAPPPKPQVGTVNVQSPDMTQAPQWYQDDQMRQLAASGGAPMVSIGASAGGRVPAYSELVAKLKAKR